MLTSCITLWKGWLDIGCYHNLPEDSKPHKRNWDNDVRQDGYWKSNAVFTVSIALHGQSVKLTDRPLLANRSALHACTVCHLSLQLDVFGLPFS